MRYLILTICVCLTALGVRGAVVTPMTLDEAISELDTRVRNKNEYLNRHEKVADSLRSELTGADDKTALRLYGELGEAFRYLSIDSALKYYFNGLTLSDSIGDPMALKFRLWTYSIMPVRGLVTEGIEAYRSIPADTISDPAMRAAYFEAGNRMYLYASSFYTVDSLKRKYEDLAARATDSLLCYLPEGSADYNFYKAQSLHNRGESSRAMAAMRDVMTQADVSDNLYARAASELAAILSERTDGNPDERLYYLVLAAISDITGGTREAVALQLAGVEMFRRGDIDRAYRYLTESEEDAILSDSRLRTLQVAESLPIISRAYERQMQNTNNRLKVIVAILLGMMVLVLITMVLLLVQRRRLAYLRKKMKQSLSIKDDYIARLLSFCSAYIERLEDFNRLAGRKIKAGQVSELYGMIESGKILQEQTRKFHELFDRTFDRIYPGFAEEVNELMLPGQKLTVPADGRLSPELRLLAFMRLGIMDSPSLSRFLGLSLNTVYAYRNKLKNRAADRENFESNLMRIGAISDV